MARELKTVHIDNQASWVKLVLHQCYINERNIYSQVCVFSSFSRFHPSKSTYHIVVAVDAVLGRDHGRQPVWRVAGDAAAD